MFTSPADPSHSHFHTNPCSRNFTYDHARRAHFPTDPEAAAEFYGPLFGWTFDDPVDPVLRQKWELPEAVPLVTEHRLHRLVCPDCGSAVLAEGDGISSSPFGPRLEAHVAVLAGVYRLSRRQIAELLGEMFATTVSVGGVNATIMRISAVLVDPWRELRDAVRHAQAVMRMRHRGGCGERRTGCGSPRPR